MKSWNNAGSPRNRIWLTPAVTAGVTGFLAMCVLAFQRPLKNIDDVVLRAVMAFACMESSIVVLLVTGLVIGKYAQNRREQVRFGRRSALQNLFAQQGDPQAAIEAANRWPNEFLAVAQDALSLLSGAQREWVKNVLRRSGWHARLLQDATDAEPARAARAVRFLGYLESDESQSSAELALVHASPLVRFAARQVILANGRLDLKLNVLRSLPLVDLWERIAMFHSIPANSPALMLFLRDAFQPGEEQLALIALELLSSIRRIVPVMVPSTLARAENIELRIRFFKAIPYCGTDRDVSVILREGLHDDDWRVRAMAAQACASLRPEGLVDDLFALCQSFSNPAEAAHAARALAVGGSEEKRRLQHLCASGSPATRQITAAVLEAQLLRTAGAQS
jgi:hypothetical protein